MCLREGIRKEMRKGTQVREASGKASVTERRLGRKGMGKGGYLEVIDLITNHIIRCSGIAWARDCVYSKP